MFVCHGGTYIYSSSLPAAAQQREPSKGGGRHGNFKSFSLPPSSAVRRMGIFVGKYCRVLPRAPPFSSPPAWVTNIEGSGRQRLSTYGAQLHSNIAM